MNRKFYTLRIIKNNIETIYYFSSLQNATKVIDEIKDWPNVSYDISSKPFNIDRDIIITRLMEI